MRKLTNPSCDPNYEILLDSYMDDKQMILRTLQNYTDGLNELDNIENEIRILGPNPELLNDIQLVRSNIESQIESIKNQNEILDKIYTKQIY